MAIGIQLASLGISPVVNRHGDIKASEPFSINTTVYSDANLVTPLLNLITTIDGEIPGYVTPGVWSLTSAGKSYQVNAIDAGRLVVTSEAPLSVMYPEFGARVDGTDDQ